MTQDCTDSQRRIQGASGRRLGITASISPGDLSYKMQLEIKGLTLSWYVFQSNRRALMMRAVQVSAKEST